MEWIQYVLLLYKFCEYLELKYSVIFHLFIFFFQTRPHSLIKCGGHPCILKCSAQVWTVHTITRAVAWQQYKYEFRQGVSTYYPLGGGGFISTLIPKFHRFLVWSLGVLCSVKQWHSDA